MLLEIFQFCSILYTIYIILSMEFPDIVQNFENNCSILFTVFHIILRVILSNIRSKIVHKIDDTLPIIFQYCTQYCSNALHKSTCAGVSTIRSLLRQGRALFRIAIARRSGFLAALFSMPALDSSSDRSSLIIAHSCFALQYVAVADAASESFHSTALVRLYFAGALPAKRGTMLRWHFSLDLP